MGSLHGGRACKYVYIYMFFIILESSGLEFSIVPAGALNWLFFFHLIQSMKNNNLWEALVPLVVSVGLGWSNSHSAHGGFSSVGTVWVGTRSLPLF